MSTMDVLEKPAAEESPDRPEVVNDFSIVIATVNGSGSQTANGLLARAAFKMGVPVSAKNLFPSNISGLPTWYAIRLSKDGYASLARGRGDPGGLQSRDRRGRPC